MNAEKGACHHPHTQTHTSCKIIINYINKQPSMSFINANALLYGL
jgi:hypothetical protein